MGSQSALYTAAHHANQENQQSLLSVMSSARCTGSACGASRTLLPCPVCSRCCPYASLEMSPQMHGKGYVVDVNAMQHIDTTTGGTCAVRDVRHSQHTQWAWKDEHGVWRTYAPEQAQQIILAMDVGQVCVWMGGWACGCGWVNG